MLHNLRVRAADRSYISRIRRIKCDEQKPACLRCTSTGRKCDGYIDVFRRDASGQTENQLKRQVNVARGPFIGLPGSAEEQRAMDFFISKTGHDLFLAFNLTPVFQLMLQISHQDDAMRSAIVALGSTGEQLQDGSILAMQRIRCDPHQSVTRFHYVKALQLLQGRIANDPDHTAAYAILLCFLFTIYEFLHGDDESGRRHLDGGLSILNNDYGRLANGLERLAPGRGLILEIARIFAAMNLQATIWLGLDVLPSPIFLTRQPIPRVPYRENTQDEDQDNSPLVFPTIDCAL